MPAKITWTGEKIDKLREMLVAGASLQECGDFFGKTRAAIHSVREKYLPEIQVPYHIRRMEVKKAREERLKNPPQRREGSLKSAQRAAFTRKKTNATRDKKWEFTVSFEDIYWPTHCPVLGIELDWFSPRKAENSPSFDRLDSTKGYVPGNVEIISWRANRIKNDGTMEEHQKIVDWLKRTNCYTILSPSFVL